MSERMADASLSVAKRILAGIVVEVDRARDSEAQKDAEIAGLLAEKKFIQETNDATIKALADALLKFGAYSTAADGRPCWCTFQEGTHMAECEAARSVVPVAEPGDTISRAPHRRELAEKDVVIKALADALRDLRAVALQAGIGGLHESILNADSALRLAGRL